MSKLTIFTALLASLASASNVWTVNCAPLSVQRSDPILSAGKPSTHVHAIVGSTAFSRSMTANAAAANGRQSTCDKPTDHSSYWAPQAYHMRSDGKFELLKFTGMVAYYQNYSCPYNPHAPGYCQGIRKAIGPPKGLRMIAGNSTRRTFDQTDPWQQAILFENGNAGEVYGLPKALDGSRLSGHVRFPSCWDGVNLDSPNHQSHVAYPDAKLHGDTQGGMCPQSHPVALVNIGAEFGWDLNGVTDPHSIVFANGDTTGYGFHGDFFAGWQDPDALTKSFSNCRSNNDCPWRKFNSPTGQDINPTAYPPQTSAPTENIGQNGPIAALPGDNPVFKPLTIKGRRVD